jgi:rhodanese-related sulfurtransferase
MKTYRDLVQEAKAFVPEVSVEEVHRQLQTDRPPVVIDVRDPDEYREGFVDGAINISRGFLEFKVQDAYPDSKSPIVLYCLSGLRSLLAAGRSCASRSSRRSR